MRRLFAIVLVAILAVYSGGGLALAAPKVALVIGNSAYAHTRVLKNPGPDAGAIAKELEKTGFEVSLKRGLSLRKIAHEGRQAKQVSFIYGSRDKQTMLLAQNTHKNISDRSLINARRQKFADLVKMAQKGNAKAMTILGFNYDNGNGVEKDIAEANKWYKKAAEKGNTNAMVRLGVSYEFGQGTAKDFAEANKWFKKAADKGDANAMFNLGGNYAIGNGVEKDIAEANRWYKKAAEKGNTNAMVRLGFNYDIGNGVEKDIAEANRWYKKAADKGNAIVMFLLGNNYAIGNGVVKNPQIAADWIYKALKAKDKFSFNEMIKNSSAWGLAFRKALQQRLLQKGYYTGKIDGEFNEATKNAIRKLAGL